MHRKTRQATPKADMIVLSPLFSGDVLGLGGCCPYMKTPLCYRWVAVGCAALLASCASRLDTTKVPMSSVPSHADASLAGKIHANVNHFRGSIGRQPLTRHAGLDRIAQAHSEFMMNNRGRFAVDGRNVSHYGFEERVLTAQRLMSMQNLAENVAAGERMVGDPAGQLVNAWKSSAKHSYNMSQNWNATGIGVAIAEDGSVFATQIFATRNDSHMALTDRFRSF